MKHKGKRPRIYRKKMQHQAMGSNGLPGYPYYPNSEDITARGTKEKLDIEQFPQRVPVNKTSASDIKEEDKPKGSDLTNDDLAALGPKDRDMDEGDDEIMALSGERYDRTGEDLDIPGAELDDQNEETGNEDEENNYYSLGGEKD